jgi:hypothetical protein
MHLSPNARSIMSSNYDISLTRYSAELGIWKGLDFFGMISYSVLVLMKGVSFSKNDLVNVS